VAGEGSQGSGLTESAVRPMSVVVALELAEYGCGVSLVDDQETVEEFAAEGADEALADGVGLRSSYRRLEVAGLFGRQKCRSGVAPALARQVLVISFWQSGCPSTGREETRGRAADLRAVVRPGEARPGGDGEASA
jgi:hypothetical protein